MYNNYGYNPYYPQQRYQGVDTNSQQPMMTTYQQPIQLTKPSSLLGKSVDNIEQLEKDGEEAFYDLRNMAKEAVLANMQEQVPTRK